MKKVLITGKNSYVGNSFEEWVDQDRTISVDKISLRNNTWKSMDFSVYDVIFHVAGIAHVSTDPKQEELYYKVNRDLTIEVARKAKKENVKQFIFMSSIIVYGEDIKGGLINLKSIPEPVNFYGKSKLEAEEGIIPFQDSNFNVSIVRPPMIYGKGSKGNYPKLAKISRKLPFFPDIENKRSMLYIDNLSEFIKILILNEENGYYFPQNKDYVKTSEMVKIIGESHSKNVKLVKIFNPFIKPFVKKINILNKLFGDLYYQDDIVTKGNYQLYSLRKSIFLTEGRTKNT